MLNPEVEDQLDKTIREYPMMKTSEAYRRVKTEMHGEGCGCNTCKNRAVNEINSWVRFICRDDIHARTTHEFNLDKGEIIPPPNFGKFD